ncbi:MAG: hypothetical protein HXS41_07440 [Theionarchaea archaeon]|nr:hypothetical protein [Theionarchaea archaeon]MBU7020878.1 hypothetical protein [Theionarchaea archaeon]
MFSVVAGVEYDCFPAAHLSNGMVQFVQMLLVSSHQQLSHMRCATFAACPEAEKKDALQIIRQPRPWWCWI